MQDLLDAIEIRKKYNSMEFEDFIKCYEEFYKIKVPEGTKEKFRCIGLINVDFITMDFINYTES